MRPRKSFARQLGRMLCLLVLHCVFSSATIIRVEEVTSGVEATPVSASLQQLEAGFVPANDDGHWSNHDFLAGITFGVMSSGIIVALLLGCQVLQVAPAGRTECQAASIEELDVPGRTEGEEVESLNYFWPRVSWLAAMLLLQSVSSLILSKFEYLVRKDSDLIFFLTMIIGLGGNAGGQSVVLNCRKLSQHQHITVRDQLATGVLIGIVLSPLAFLRGLMSKSDLGTCVTLAAATLSIASVATSIGTALPKMLQMLKADPGEAAAMIQVIMDIVGMMVTCCLGALILDAF